MYSHPYSAVHTNAQHQDFYNFSVFDLALHSASTVLNELGDA